MNSWCAKCVDTNSMDSEFPRKSKRERVIEWIYVLCYFASIFSFHYHFWCQWIASLFTKKWNNKKSFKTFSIEFQSFKYVYLYTCVCWVYIYLIFSHRIELKALCNSILCLLTVIKWNIKMFYVCILYTV